MLATATITSKGQLTIPAKFLSDGIFKIGDKVTLTKEGSSVKMIPSLSLVRQLAGSVKTNKKVKNNDLDAIILEAKRKYFSKRA